MAEPIISVDHVSMKFHLNMNHTSSLKEFFVQKLTGKLRYHDFYALEDVSFQVMPGDVMGIVGRNGSGKSTVLKVISGIYKPTTGRALTRGSIAPMLELGSGFDFELTGRENIFLNGAILGFSEEFLKSRYDAILEFSELGAFIDQPIKTYSSGMVMRLAFSVATQIEPEILIVDEILAVGDERFQHKSFDRMTQLIGSGCTVLMVSHNLDQIRKMCNKVVWLDKGHVRMAGDVGPVCDAYAASMKE